MGIRTSFQFLLYFLRRISCFFCASSFLSYAIPILSSTTFSTLSAAASLCFSSYSKPSQEQRQVPLTQVLIEVTFGSACSVIYYKLTITKLKLVFVLHEKSVFFIICSDRDLLSFLQSMLKIGTIALLIILASANYSELLGEKLCRLTVASYCKKADVERWSCGPCKNSPLAMKNIKTFQNSSMDTLGYIGTSEELNAIVLVFRGTLPWDIKNWISDINFIAVNYPLCNNSCKVHRGFYYAFVDIQKQILSTVVEYKQKFNLPNLIVTGHSLGAAIATHTVAYLLANKIKVTDFYNYGCPRVGDAKFTVWFNQLYGKDHFKARVTHRRDPVPHLPFEDWGFMHVNTEVFYKGSKKEGGHICNDASAQDKKCCDTYKLDTDVFDHLTYYDIDFAGIILACQ